MKAEEEIMWASPGKQLRWIQKTKQSEINPDKVVSKSERRQRAQRKYKTVLRVCKNNVADVRKNVWKIKDLLYIIPKLQKKKMQESTVLQPNALYR